MSINLLLAAIIILSCVLCNKISTKIGLPMLLAFILLGMFFGSDGIVKIAFNDYRSAEQVCSVALIFIMFYGGFGTNWREARPIAPQAIVLSSLGTILTAGLVGLFCYFVLRVDFLESMLIGAVISSTDAASVFSILRSKHLNLRYRTASLLEIESGSNDPFSYMLTIIILALMGGQASGSKFVSLFFSQIFFGVLFGALIAALSLFVLKRLTLSSAGFNAIFIVGIAIFSYALPSLFGGNGYLSTYIVGIILGNSPLKQKQELVHFFDAATGLMQMVLFFLLGLLSFPSILPEVALIGLSIAVFLTFVARPIVVFFILSPFKSKLPQRLLVSWAGMRGAASIVFAIMAEIHPASTNHDVFHVVFFIVLFSILLQGTLIPFIARKLDMTDQSEDVMKTFNDYTDEIAIQFIQFEIPHSHPWVNQKIHQIVLPPDSIFVTLTRNNRNIVPTGNTMLYEGDVLILAGSSIQLPGQAPLYEKRILSSDDFTEKPLSQLPLDHARIIIIKRDKDVIIPNGSTKLKENDLLIITK